MTTGTKVLLGILGAAAAGVVVGLLIAPDKGSETRRKIFSGAKGLPDGLNSQLKESVEKLRSKATHLADKAESKFDEVKNSAKNKTDQFRSSNG